MTKRFKLLNVYSPFYLIFTSICIIYIYKRVAEQLGPDVAEQVVQVPHLITGSVRTLALENVFFCL